MILYQSGESYGPYQHHTHSHRVLATITSRCAVPTHRTQQLPGRDPSRSRPFIALSVKQAWKRRAAAAVRTQFANIIYRVYQHLRTALSTPLWPITGNKHPDMP